MELFNALRSARNTVGAIDSKLAKLRSERAAVAAAPPHIDDLKAWALRGLDTSRDHFLSRLKRWHFNDEALKGYSGETIDAHAGPQLLGITPTVPNGTGPVVGGSYMNGSEPVDLAAVTYFLRPAIEAALPKLIEESFPGSRKGLRSVERKAKLQKLDGQIAALETERNELAAEIKDAHRALETPANTLSTDDTEAAEAVAAGLVMNVE
jgi:hypothetical protein